jgi:hypothetical protein
MRRKVVLREPEDLTGLAGWLFTELLLALTVVFLATISFVPQFFGATGSSINNLSGQPTYTFSKIFDEVLTVTYPAEANVETIKTDLRAFLAQNSLPPDALVASVQIVGGYNEATESATAGINRALKFSDQLDAADPMLLAFASTTIGSSRSIQPNAVTVSYSFVADVKAQ